MRRNKRKWDKTQKNATNKKERDILVTRNCEIKHETNQQRMEQDKTVKQQERAGQSEIEEK